MDAEFSSRIGRASLCFQSYVIRIFTHAHGQEIKVMTESIRSRVKLRNGVPLGV